MSDERRDEVHAVAALVTGAVGGSMKMFAAQMLVDASVEPQLSDDGERVTSVDVILKDGWRIRFRTSLVTPDGVELQPMNRCRYDFACAGELCDHAAEPARLCGNSTDGSDYCDEHAFMRS